jgi:hypothetical protein
MTEITNSKDIKVGKAYGVYHLSRRFGYTKVFSVGYAEPFKYSDKVDFLAIHHTIVDMLGEEYKGDIRVSYDEGFDMGVLPLILFNEEREYALFELTDDEVASIISTII